MFFLVNLLVAIWGGPGTNSIGPWTKKIHDWVDFDGPNSCFFCFFYLEGEHKVFFSTWSEKIVMGHILLNIFFRFRKKNLKVGNVKFISPWAKSRIFYNFFFPLLWSMVILLVEMIKMKKMKKGKWWKEKETLNQ